MWRARQFKFIDRGLKSRIVAIELSNEPWQSSAGCPKNRRALRMCALTPLGLRFALPLTVMRQTRNRLSDNGGSHDAPDAVSSHLKRRSDIYSVTSTQRRKGETVDGFNKAVKPFAEKMRYLVTGINIRHGSEGNPHLTNKYAMNSLAKLQM
jgi:hypothetical protein